LRGIDGKTKDTIPGCILLPLESIILHVGVGKRGRDIASKYDSSSLDLKW